MVYRLQILSVTIFQKDRTGIDIPGCTGHRAFVQGGCFVVDTSFGLHISSIHDDVGIDGFSVRLISTESVLTLMGRRLLR